MSSLGPLLAAAAALAAVIGGYLQFVVRRSLLPCIEFDVALTLLQPSAAATRVAEVTLSIKNVGPGVGFVKNVRCRVLYRLVGELDLHPNGVEPQFAHRLADIANRLSNGDAGSDTAVRSEPPDRAAEAGKIVRLTNPGDDPRFIQAGVTQWYRRPLTFPADADLVRIRGEFDYATGAGPIRRAVAKLALPELAAQKGSLKRAVPYTVRRTFAVTTTPSTGS
ncbi:hypothetical protein [Geodermatophilus sabuli]|uniref:hypothetical protein n=1 Tax=Geodermatophilus sabuli TaxID=1564158 RepID=UPI001179910E|nr:hypothetical protein [Geodermatophilus sabuli]MBB3082642.1 hypothetical protein [Geodermatophilus sabuli]